MSFDFTPTFAAGNLTLGQMNAIVKKLGGEEGARRFLRGELVVAEVEPKPAELKIWKTIKLGAHKNVDAFFKKALKSSSWQLGEYAKDMMKQKSFTLATEEMEVDLVVLSVGDLGFKNDTWYQYICMKAQELGLKLCPAEVGPALRLAYKDQPTAEQLSVAMEAITDSRGDPGIFEVGHYGGDDLLSLYCVSGQLGRFWHTDSRFIFVLPRK